MNSQHFTTHPSTQNNIFLSPEMIALISKKNNPNLIDLTQFPISEQLISEMSLFMDEVNLIIEPAGRGGAIEDDIRNLKKFVKENNNTNVADIWASVMMELTPLQELWLTCYLELRNPVLATRFQSTLLNRPEDKQKIKLAFLLGSQNLLTYNKVGSQNTESTKGVQAKTHNILEGGLIN